MSDGDKDRYNLKVERGDSGAWFVTSPDDPGLLVAGMTDLEALALVPKYLADLREARRSAKKGGGGS